VRVFFGDVRRDTAADRLRRLYDGGLLEVRSTDRAQENVYALGPKGRAWASDHGLSVPRVPRGEVSHHLGIVAAWTKLAAAAHRARDVRLARFRPDWDLRASRSFSGVVPDALVEFSLAGVGVRFAVELDRRTERPPALRAKLEAYLSSGITGEEAQNRSLLGLVFLTERTHARRRAVVEETVATLWPNWWTLLDLALPPEDLLARILAAAQAPLTPSPCGKGSLSDPNSPAATVRDPEHDRP
jgi:hypothetical protein